MNKDYHRTFINFLLVAMLSVSAVGLSGCDENPNLFQRTIEVPGKEMKGLNWTVEVAFEESATAEDREEVKSFVRNFLADKPHNYIYDGSRGTAIVVKFSTTENEKVTVPDEIYNVTKLLEFSNNFFSTGWDKQFENGKIYSMKY